MLDHADDILLTLLQDAVTTDVFVAGRSDEKSTRRTSTASQRQSADDVKYTAQVADGVEVVKFLLGKAALDLSEYVTWNRLGIAFKNSYGEEGFAPWLAFSEAADGFESEEACRKAWDGIKERNAGEEKRTIATYFKLAKECGWIPPKRGKAESENTEASSPPGKGDDLTAYTVALAETAGDELWVDREGKPHVSYVETLPNGTEVQRHLPVTGSEYQEVLNARFFLAAEGQRALRPEQGSGAAAILAMKAKRSGLAYPTFLRAGEHEGVIYVDIGDASGCAVAISGDGWKVIADPPVRFVRGSRGALPLPEEGGSLADFACHLNLEPDDLKRAIGFMVGTFNTVGSYAILITDGEQGSCKSTMNDKVLGLTDPPHQAKSARMSFNPKEQDLHILAQGAHVLYFDNVSSLTADAADVLCRIATGGASGSRELYTNDGFTQFVVVRPVILTCIGVPSTRADLLDRSVRVVAQPVARRRTERAVQAEFTRDQPKLLGFVFSCVAAALANRDKVEAAVEDDTLALPRMADFAAFVEGAHEMLELELGGFSKLLSAGQTAMQIESARGDILGDALVTNFSRPTASPIHMSASDILNLLKASRPDAKGWPAPNVFSRRLKRIAVGLRLLGIEFEIEEATGHDNVAKYRIWTTDAFQPQGSEPDDLEVGGGHF
jgi:hypothetical protein